MSDGKAPRLAWRVAVGLSLLAAAGLGVVAVRVWPRELAVAMELAVRTTRGMGVAGWAVAACAQVVVALLGILPASAGAIAAGLLYGVLPGFVLAATGTLVGAGLAFLLTRSLFRPLVVRAMARHPRLDRLDEAVARDGWRLVCLMRISPIMPFAITSYALGLTSLGLRPYMLGTLASLPALLGYVVMGQLAGSGLGALTHPGAGWLRWVLLGTAILATALLTWRLGRIVARVMRLPDERSLRAAGAR